MVAKDRAGRWRRGLVDIAVEVIPSCLTERPWLFDKGMVVGIACLFLLIIGEIIKAEVFVGTEDNATASDADKVFLREGSSPSHPEVAGLVGIYPNFNPIGSDLRGLVEYIPKVCHS